MAAAKRPVVRGNQVVGDARATEMNRDALYSLLEGRSASPLRLAALRAGYRRTGEGARRHISMYGALLLRFEEQCC